MIQERDPRVRSSRARKLFFQVYLTFLLGTPAVLLLPNASVSVAEGSNLAFSISWIIVHIASVPILVTGTWRLSDLFSTPVVFGALCMASSLWSPDPMASILYGGMLTANILVARQLAQEMSPLEILQLCTKTIILLCTVSIVLYYLQSSQVIWYDTRGRTNVFGGEMLRGLFPHRIAGAIYATIAAMGALSVMRGTIRAVSILVSVWFILLTASATGYVLLIVALVSYAVVLGGIRSKASPSAFFVTRFAAAALGIVIVWVSWDALLEALGRDGTLTARTYLWDWGFQAWREKPFFGWGYNAYFESGHAMQFHSSSAELRYYDVPHFHQSFIQTSVDLGLLGLALLVLIVMRVLVGSYRLRLRNDARVAATFFSYSLLLVVAAFTGYVFPEYNHFGTFMLFLIYFVVKTQDDRSLTFEAREKSGSSVMPFRSPNRIRKL